jgi:hypothetical protein
MGTNNSTRANSRYHATRPRRTRNHRGTTAGHIWSEREHVRQKPPSACGFTAPGVGLEPTTYGLTVPENSSRADHIRPPRPGWQSWIPLSSTAVHQRPRARLSVWLSSVREHITHQPLIQWCLTICSLGGRGSGGVRASRRIA